MGNRLRTLKDLEIETEDGDIYSTTLKHEAMEWIIEGDLKAPVIHWIREFFNLTEEDFPKGE